MAAIRSSGNQGTELRLAGLLRKAGITGWRRKLKLPGHPDFAFRGERLALFVDGCFWHGCPQHGRKPKSNRSYWLPKLRRNRKRDLEVGKLLRGKGWKVLRLWEHELKKTAAVLRKIRARLGRD